MRKVYQTYIEEYKSNNYSLWVMFAKFAENIAILVGDVCKLLNNREQCKNLCFCSDRTGTPPHPLISYTFVRKFLVHYWFLTCSTHSIRCRHHCNKRHESSHFEFPWAQFANCVFLFSTGAVLEALMPYCFGETQFANISCGYISK